MNRCALTYIKSPVINCSCSYQKRQHIDDVRKLLSWGVQRKSLHNERSLQSLQTARVPNHLLSICHALHDLALEYIVRQWMRVLYRWLVNNNCTSWLPCLLDFQEKKHWDTFQRSSLCWSSRSSPKCLQRMPERHRELRKKYKCEEGNAWSVYRNAFKLFLHLP